MGRASQGGAADECTACLTAYLARAFDLAEMPDSAIAMYECYLAKPRLLYYPSPPRQLDPAFLAGAHKRVGELYQDADPDLALRVSAVRQRIARLRAQEAR